MSDDLKKLCEQYSEQEIKDYIDWAVAESCKLLLEQVKTAQEANQNMGSLNE